MSEQWEGCEEVHWDCRIAQLEAELDRRDEYILKNEAVIADRRMRNVLFF